MTDTADANNYSSECSKKREKNGETKKRLIFLIEREKEGKTERQDELIDSSYPFFHQGEKQKQFA